MQTQNTFDCFRKKIHSKELHGTEESWFAFMLEEYICHKTLKCIINIVLFLRQTIRVIALKLQITTNMQHKCKVQLTLKAFILMVSIIVIISLNSYQH